METFDAAVADHAAKSRITGMVIQYVNRNDFVNAVELWVLMTHEERIMFRRLAPARIRCGFLNDDNWTSISRFLPILAVDVNGN